jgi:hypothetical protein
MLWGYFAAGRTGELHKIDGVMRGKCGYIDATSRHVRKLKLGRNFQLDDDPKHTSKVVAKWLKDNKVKLFD